MKMKFVCLDFFDRPVHRCLENNVLWKDLSDNDEPPQLYSCQNEIDGEPGYPIGKNLEVVFLDRDEAKEKQKYASLDFNTIVFPQIWRSTCTGFDEATDGSPAIGGSAMTKEYTTVLHETLTGSYVICFGDRPCYKVTNPNEDFLHDLMRHSMASLKEAQGRY